MNDLGNKAQIAAWWAANPQTYGTEHGGTTYNEDGEPVTVDFGSEQFFRRADRQFIGWNVPLHDANGPFGRIFPYARYVGRPVLEIGCGMGFMSSLWAEHGAHVTAVDLNPVAIEQTRKRFELFGLNGQIRQEDANRLSFDDATFDYVYSWGVLHHSPDLDRSIAELFRVLRPGGGFGVMLYNRRSWLYRYQIQYLEGFLHRESRFLNPLELASRYTDGGDNEGNPHTWPLTPAEARSLFGPYASRLNIRVLGTDLDGIFAHMVPGLSRLIPKVVMKSWARRWGWSLWISGEKAV